MIFNLITSNMLQVKEVVYNFNFTERLGVEPTPIIHSFAFAKSNQFVDCVRASSTPLLKILFNIEVPIVLGPSDVI